MSVVMSSISRSTVDCNERFEHKGLCQVKKFCTVPKYTVDMEGACGATELGVAMATHLPYNCCVQ